MLMLKTKSLYTIYIYIYILLYFIYLNILRLKVNIVTKDIDYQIVRKRKLTQSQHLVNTHL